MSEIIIHGFAASTYTRTARIAALEKGIGHRLVPLAFRHAEHFALHPFAKMPVMTHGSVTVFETLAIMTYIDATFPGPRLFPDDVAARVATMTACSVAIDYAYPALVGDEGGEAARVLDWLDTSAGHAAYLAGDAITAADLILAPMLAFHLARAQGEAALAGRPALARWLAAMTERPSFAATDASAAAAA